jgi:hypothetical protein
MKLEIEIIAEDINRKELVEKINQAIDEETADIHSVEILYSECDEDD